MSLDSILPQDFNAESIVAEAGDGNFDPIPDGWYRLNIERAEMKPTASGGQMLSLGVKVTSAAHTGRWVWFTLNLLNASEKAQKIAIEDFARLCSAVGIAGRPKHVNELLFKEFDGLVKTELDQNSQKRNTVKGYAKAGSKSGGSEPARPVRTAPVNDADFPF